MKLSAQCEEILINQALFVLVYFSYLAVTTPMPPNWQLPDQN